MNYSELKNKQNYTIHFAPYSQDKMGLRYFGRGNKMPYSMDFEKVLAYSIRAGYISSKEEIVTLVDGADNIEAYFTANTPEEELLYYIEWFNNNLYNDEEKVYLERGKTEYNLF